MVNKLPKAIKELTGTYRPSRDAQNSLNASGKAPVAPPFFITHDDAIVEIYWNLVAHTLAMGIVSQEDDYVLGMLALRMHEIMEATQEIEDHGGPTYETTSKNGDRMYRTHPAVARRNEALRHAQSLLIECGLTPVARAKVGAGGPTDPNDPWGAFA